MERLLASKEGSENDELVYLRATPDGKLLVSGIEVSVATVSVESGIGTSRNQLEQIGLLAELADGNDKWAAYKLVQTEDLGAGIKHILKSDGTKWLLIRKTYTDTTTALTFAGPGNNDGVTLATAWGQRNTLTYGYINTA